MTLSRFLRDAWSRMRTRQRRDVPHSKYATGRIGVPLLAAAASFACMAIADPVFAHGFAGKRFFPATVATDDPFVADELSLPTITSRKLPPNGDEPATRATDFSLDLSKRITQNLGIGFGATYKRLSPEGADAQRGFDNVAASLKYQFYNSDERETILSAGVDWDIGGSGAKRVGAESFSTFTPTLFAGKGLGDLADGMRYLRPLALTGTAGIAVPTRASTSTLTEDGELAIERHPHVLNLGFAIEYSIPYLQAFVKDVGLREPFNRLIPLVEFAVAKPLDRGGGASTATFNPGVIWAGRYMQFALEAVVPMNAHTGSRVGWSVQVHFFLDDVFPRTIGKPLFGN